MDIKKLELLGKIALATVERENTNLELLNTKNPDYAMALKNHLKYVTDYIESLISSGCKVVGQEDFIESVSLLRQLCEEPVRNNTYKSTFPKPEETAFTSDEINKASKEDSVVETLKIAKQIDDLINRSTLLKVLFD